MGTTNDTANSNQNNPGLVAPARKNRFSALHEEEVAGEGTKEAEGSAAEGIERIAAPETAIERSPVAQRAAQQ